MRTTTILLGASILLSGCATNKTLQATGGSRADGTVDLSFQYTQFEKPIVDYQAGASIARERCAAWGYTNADPFGGAKTNCQAFNGYGNCINTIVTMTYQCTGAESDRKAQAPSASSNAANISKAATSAAPVQSIKRGMTVEERLQELDDLYERGRISKEEYDRLRAKILTDM